MGITRKDEPAKIRQIHSTDGDYDNLIDFMQKMKENKVMQFIIVADMVDHKEGQEIYVIQSSKANDLMRLIGGMEWAKYDLLGFTE